jgi:hypothetical protein
MSRDAARLEFGNMFPTDIAAVNLVCSFVSSTSAARTKLHMEESPEAPVSAH